MSAFAALSAIPPQRVWEGILARGVHGERLSLAVVELDPNAVVGLHEHDHEQLGIVLMGSLRFTVGDETRDLGPGETWCIPSNTRHEATAGPDGAVVIDVFAPVREDWRALPTEERAPRWPRASGA